MFHLLLRWFWITTLLLSVVATASADNEGNAGKRPTLRDAVDAAFERHPEQTVHHARIQEAAALSARAASPISGAPSLEFGYKSDQIGSNDGFREWEAGINLPLWNRGQRDAESRLAKSSQHAVDQHERSLRLAVAGEVRERLWRAALMKNHMRLQKQERDAAEALQQSINRRVELGELARTNLLLAQDSTLSKQASFLRAQKDFTDALRRYHAYTGHTHLPHKRGEQQNTATQLPEDHPLLAEVKIEVEQAEMALASVQKRRGGNPELFIGGSGDRATNDARFNSRLGLSISIPIGTMSSTRPAIAAAELRLAEANAAYATRHRALQLAFDEAAQEVESILAEYALATKQDELAQQSLKMAEVAFDAGESSLLDLLRVQNLAFAAKRREQELKITRQRAIARFNQAAGVLP